MQVFCIGVSDHPQEIGVDMFTETQNIKLLPMLCVADYYVLMCQNFCCTQMVNIQCHIVRGSSYH
jgi:hypothetical protein